MKIVLILILITSSMVTFGQKFYSTTGGEIIYSDVILSQNGKNVPTNGRFTLFYHFESSYHFDFYRHIGLITGFGIRNIGFISDENNITMKYRSYSLGVPLTIKIGNLGEQRYIYAGAEYEMMFHYKEKVIENGSKTKQSEWFSDKVNRFIPSAFCGLQFANGLNLKFKLYLDDFLNTEYKATENNVQSYPFENITSQIYYFAISYTVRNKKIKEKINKSEDVFVKL